jgi:hypothetical protein
MGRASPMIPLIQPAKTSARAASVNATGSYPMKISTRGLCIQIPVPKSFKPSGSSQLQKIRENKVSMDSGNDLSSSLVFL